MFTGLGDFDAEVPEERRKRDRLILTGLGAIVIMELVSALEYWLLVA